MTTYHNDNIIRIDHSPQSNSTPTANNVIGSTTSSVRTIDFTPSDSNCIYVSTSGNSWDYSTNLFETPQALSIDLVTGDIVKDSATGYWKFLASDESDVDLTAETYTEGARWTEVMTGTSSDPISSISQANDLITATKTKIYIVDSGTYTETPFILNADCEGIYSAVGQTPIISISKLGVVPQNSIADLTTTSSSPNQRVGMCELENGDIFVVYTISNDIYAVTLDGTTLLSNNDDQVIYAETATVKGFDQAACCLTSSNDIFIIFQDTTDFDIKYFVVDKDDFTTLNKAVTTFQAETVSYYPTCLMKDDGDILIMFSDGTNIDYGVIDGSAYTITTASTQLVASRVRPEINKLKNGNILLTYMNSTTIYYQELTQALSSVVAETTTGLTNTSWTHSASVLSNGYIAIIYDNNDLVAGLGRTCSYKIFDSSFNVRISAQDSEIEEIINITMINVKDNIVYVGFNTQAAPDPDNLVYNSKVAFPYYIETPSGQACKFDGIKFNITHSRYMENFILQRNDFTFKNCNIQNVNNISGADNLGLINNESDHDNIITNCLFLDSYLKTSLETNNADIQQNIFFNIVNDPAIEIDGNGANIILDHNTFFNCYAGILLTNNDGNEIIKNSIFHEMVNYDVKCGTTLEIAYCCSTGTLTTCTTDSNTLFVNPRFKNLGIDYTTNLDLNLKSEALGDDYTSPCIANAGDSKDIGAYDRSIVYSSDTYSTIYIQKPDEIDIQYNSVNNSRNVNLDGTVRTYKDGAIKELSLKWTGILNDDYNELLAFWYSHAGKVKVYLDPETSPNDYEVYYLDYKNIKGSPKKSPLLSKTGVSDVEIILVKAYKG